MMLKSWWKLGALVLILSMGLIWFAITFKKFLDTPLVPTDKTIDYVLNPGASIKVLARDLHEMGVLENPNFLILLGYWKGLTKSLQAGEYLFAAGTTPSKLLAQIAAGGVIYHRFVLLEGWNFRQVMDALNDNPRITHQLTNLNTANIMNALGYPLRHPEGQFFPATYHFTKGVSDIALLLKSYQIMSKQLAQEWSQRAANLPYQNSYQALIAASLVEKETAQATERPLVAGIIINRLKKNMPLQIDSTVIYGLGQAFRGKLSRDDLRKDTPYNTYVHKGLPPTPIAMPSLQSIHATLHPVLSDSLYFVAKGNGRHQFSSSLTAQNKAVATYQINVHYPKVGKKLNIKTHRYLWYLSPTLQKLFIKK